MNTENILSLIKHLNQESIDKILLEINRRDDFYVEWINKNDGFDEDFIQKCKDYENNLLDLEAVNYND